jgi:type IV pilus assembly protein PilQ
LGYFVTTTTQTSTLQDVRFLEVGVVLTVTPLISHDGQVVMKVLPKVSSGDINPTTTLPEEETTEVDTSIMVPDGHGVIIGGLIQETDNERQSKVPLLGDIWLIGRLFQRRSVERERSEVVVALLPRIVPTGNCPTPAELEELQRVALPLLTPNLQSAPRPEPKLKDAIKNPLFSARR